MRTTPRAGLAPLVRVAWWWRLPRIRHMGAALQPKSEAAELSGKADWFGTGFAGVRTGTRVR
jgi:hypothetical protein